ncbi:MAG TPA: sugar phosphate isomerase/epimerase [Opitutus sp.]|nr:sugar phosphate isomerase/epimerase [Opitutus sp.]
MSRDLPLTRRAALKRAALSAAAVSLARFAPSLSAAESSTPPAPDSTRDRSRRLKLGVASISLKNLSVADAAAVLRQLEIGDVSIFRTHANFQKDTPEQCRAAADGFRAGGVEPGATSVVNLTTDEAAMRRAFENVRAARIPIMTCSPSPASLPLAEKFVREYDIRLAIHNHGPEDKTFPSPYEPWKLIQSLDSRIGLCIDVGHSMRAGVDPVEAIHRCASRLYGVHLKDSLAAVGAKDIPAIVGRGRMDIPAILTALAEVRYAGAAAFEYEVETGNPVVGLSESVGYVRGLMTAMWGKS